MYGVLCLKERSHCEIVQYDHMLLLIAKVVFVTIISKCIKFYIAEHKGEPLMEESELFLTLTICYICNKYDTELFMQKNKTLNNIVTMIMLQLVTIYIKQVIVTVYNY